jgi:hypothetical protein
MFYCSDEQLALRDSDVTEDLPTSAMSTSTAYSPNVFVAEITTVKTDPSAAVPGGIEIDMSGSGGKISINWGDGVIEKVILQPYFTPFYHHYNRVKNYTIKIDGEIKNIQYFGISYQELKLRDLHLSGLTGLKELELLVLSQSPEVINLSHNKLIENLFFVDLTNLRDIILPTTNNINSILLYGDTQLSTAVVDRIVDRVYQSVVSNPRSGSFALGITWVPECGEMIGPPSSFSVTKLRRLRDNYGWEIDPSPCNN